MSQLKIGGRGEPYVFQETGCYSLSDPECVTNQKWLRTCWDRSTQDTGSLGYCIEEGQDVGNGLILILDANASRSIH